jgi:isopropylmalate/homocitrate/citramalate synthase
MMKGSFKSDKWFVSPWNFEPEVTKDFVFKRDIKIHDVTMRDGEQQAGLVLNKDDKIALAEKLAEAGVHRIEAGMPAVSAQDKEAITEIAKRNLSSEIFAFGRCMKQDVELAADCGVDGVIIEIPSSEHIIKYAYRWPLEKAIELSIEATQLAKKYGLYTVFFPIDASRADIKWFLDLIERIATEGHMDALVAVDTFGGLSPHAITYMIKKIKERVQKPLEVHFHDDFNFGAANTVMALAAGADVAHTTIAGVGERAGNAPYESLVLSLLTMYGVDLGIKTEKLYGIAKFLREATGMPIRPNTPVVGDTLFNIESGIVTNMYKNSKDEAPNEIYPFLPELAGQYPSKIVLGKHSGLPSVDLHLRSLGIEATDEEQAELLQAIKDLAVKKKDVLRQDEFENLIKVVLGK